MSALKQSLHRIPYWAYLLVIMVIIVNSVYLYYKGQVPDDGLSYKLENGQWIVANYNPGSAAYNAGIRPGDIILSVNSKPFDTWRDGYQGLRAGDSGSYQIIRDNREIHVTVILGSYFSDARGFFWALYIVILLFSIASLYILVKKPQDKAVRLFFVYLQLFAFTVNAWSMPFPDLPALFACNVFLLSSCLFGPILIHFHLLFPRPVRLFNRFKRFPLLSSNMLQTRLLTRPSFSV